MTDRAATSDARLTIWGSRGSVSISNPDAVRYGGHTTCIELEVPDGRILIDAGSGLLEQYRQRPGLPADTLLLVTHLHWDHILGFPFYAPLYQTGWNLDVRGVSRGGTPVWNGLVDVNRPPLFPIDLREKVNATVRTEELEPAGSTTYAGVEVSWIPVEHPGGCTAYRLTYGDRSVVFTGDVEIPATDRDALIAFTRGASLLICDAQYSEEQYERHVGWGHSSNMQAAALARDAGVDRLILTHHDPMHSDADIDALVEQARGVFANTSAASSAMKVFETDA